MSTPAADLTGSLTPIEQDDLPAETPLEELLFQVMWPAEVHGTAVVVERLVLPPGAEDLPDDPAEAAVVAAGHPDRQEVRMVAGRRRGPGRRSAPLRLREHDEDFAVIEGPDLVPALLQLLQSTLADSPDDAGDRDGVVRHVSGLFDDPPDPAAADGAAAAPAALARAAWSPRAVLVVRFFVLSAFTGLWTDRLWFNSVGYGEVFSTVLTTRVLLFIVFGLVMGGFVAANVVLAFRNRPPFRAMPSEANLERYREVVEPLRAWVVVAVAGLLALVAGGSAAGQWRTLPAVAQRWRLRHRGPLLRP